MRCHKIPASYIREHAEEIAKDYATFILKYNDNAMKRNEDSQGDVKTTKGDAISKTDEYGQGDEKSNETNKESDGLLKKQVEKEIQDQVSQLKDYSQLDIKDLKRQLREK